jgi:hypothetical protein
MGRYLALKDPATPEGERLQNEALVLGARRGKLARALDVIEGHRTKGHAPA